MNRFRTYYQILLMQQGFTVKGVAAKIGMTPQSVYYDMNHMPDQLRVGRFRKYAALVGKDIVSLIRDFEKWDKEHKEVQ